MIKKNNHLVYYLSQFSLIILGIFLVIYFSPDKNFQILSIIGVSIGYILIGIIHHLINHDLVFKIVVEYILIASLGISVAYFIFKGGFGF